MTKWFRAICFLFFLAGTGAHASEYPTRPIRLVVPFSAGGSADSVGRIMAQELNTPLGNPVIVENRPGASGNIGAEAVASAKPDGYTLLLATSPFAVNISLYRKLSYHPARDFTPISLVALQPNVLVVHPSLPVRTVADLIVYAKSHPGELNFGSSGAGASQHLAAELFMRQAEVEMTHVPYRGGAAAMTDLLAGRVHLMFETLPSALPHVRDGRLRPIAVTTSHRSDQLPQVPTFSESGLPNCESRGWLGIVAPAGTPREIIEKLSTLAREIVRKRAVADLLKTMGLEVVGSSPTEFRSFVGAEIEAYRELIAKAKISID
jgi:tripartite-type tricarboxylate transporter receptor subunit TctC